MGEECLNFKKKMVTEVGLWWCWRQVFLFFLRTHVWFCETCNVVLFTSTRSCIEKSHCRFCFCFSKQKKTTDTKYAYIIFANGGRNILGIERTGYHMLRVAVTCLLLFYFEKARAYNYYCIKLTSRNYLVYP